MTEIKTPKIYVYDFEVYSKQTPAWWCVTFIEDKDRNNPITFVNDVVAFKDFYLHHKCDLFVGYNSRSYDQWIFKAILKGMDVGQVNDELIEQGKRGFEVVPNGNKIQLFNYDAMLKDKSLKQLEGFGGYKIKETDVPFNKKEPLTDKEVNEIIEYNIYDVVSLLNVLDCTRGDFDAQLEVIKMFDLDMSLFNKTKAQLASYVLGAVSQHTLNDEFEITIPANLNMPINYQYIIDWYKNDFNKAYSVPFKTLENNGTRQLLTTIGGCPAVFGYGGVHASKDNQIFEGIIIIMDVASLYPSLMINEGYVSRKLKEPNKFRELRDRRIVLKKAKDPRQEPLKIIINSVYGILKDRNNACYDPLMSNNVCIAGQLYLTELSARLENHCEILQINTDGIYVRVPTESDIDTVLNIAHEWEERTKLELEFKVFKKGKLIQKDVNNYILLDTETGRYKSKGTYVKSLSDIDNDLPIINKALVDYFVKNIPIEDTINNCNKLIEFQKIIKLSNKYNEVVYGDIILKEKVHRVFASTRPTDRGIFKVKFQKGEKKYEKVANTPDCCFIDNDDVRDKLVPHYLDRQYYIDMANERIKQFLTVDEVKVDDTPNKLYECMLKANNYIEFLSNCSESKITKKQLEGYLLANCCSNYSDDIDRLVKFYDYHKLFNNKEKITLNTLNKKLEKRQIDEQIYEIILKYSKLNKTGKSLIEVNYKAILNEIFNYLPTNYMSPVTILKAQWEKLGCLNYTDNTIENNVYVVLNWRDVIKPTAVLYQLKTGNIIYQKFDKATFDILPLQDGDIIRTMKTETRYENYIWDKDEKGIAIWAEDKNRPYKCVIQYELLERDYSIKKSKSVCEDYTD